MIIVGAGLVGLLTAFELAEAGLRVRIFDQSRAAREASWAGGGILSPLHPWRYSDAINALADLGRCLYPVLTDNLRGTTGIDPEFWRCGLEVRAADPGAASWCARHDRRHAHWTEQTALFLADVAQVRTPRLGQALRARLKALNAVQLIEHEPVHSLCIQQGRCAGVTTRRGVVQAGQVVVAAGAWSSGLVGARAGPAVEPVRGQMLGFAAEPGLLSHVILEDRHYVIPRRDGLVVVGSTLEHAGFDKTTTEAAQAELTAAAARLLPTLEHKVAEHQWAGLRPALTGHGGRAEPWIGPHPEIDKLFFNTGHFRNGVVLAPGSAQLLKALLLGETPPLRADPFTVQPMTQA